MNMSNTIYVKIFKDLYNHVNICQMANILGNHSRCNKLLDLDNLEFSFKTMDQNKFESLSMMLQIPASSKSYEFHSAVVKYARGEDKKSKKANFHTSPDKLSGVTKCSRRNRLKKFIKEYGLTVIAFHASICLISFSCTYLLISTGLDISWFFETIGLSEWLSSDAGKSAGTFVITYAIYKLFLPIRILITLAAVPFIVRYLRKTGYLKK